MHHSRFVRYILILAITIASINISPAQNAFAQASFPAQLNKSFVPTTIPSGGTSLFTVTIFNPNTFQLTNAGWLDNLPAGMIIATPPGANTTCAGGTVTAVAGGNTLQLSGGTVPPQVGAIPGQCSVTVNVTSSTPGNHVNTLPAGALTSTGNGNPITNTTPASATLTVQSVAAPTINKNFQPLTTINVGGTTNLRIRINNVDPLTTLTNVNVTDNLPAGVTVAGAPTLTGCGAGATATTTATSLTLNNGTIAPSTTCTILVPVTSNTAGIYNNVIPPNAITTQQGVTNAAQATATLNVQDVSLGKTFVPPSVLVGNTSTLTITLNNPTGADYTGAAITDNLPGGVVVANPPAPTTTCGAGVVTAVNGAGSLNLANGTIPANGSCTITVTVRVTTANNHTNTLPAGALTTDQGATNVLPATANLNGQALGTGAGGSKNFTPATIASGGTSRLRINITAPPDTALTNLAVTDNLPANVFIANPPNASTNCGAGATVTAVAGGTTFSLSGGTLAAGASCLVDVFVTSTVSGPHLNTVPAGGITNAENRPNTTPFNATLTVLSGLSLAKSFTPATVSSGGTSSLTITVTNTNIFPLTNVALTDPLPTAGGRTITVGNPANASTTCGAGGVVTAVPGTQTVSLSGGTVPAQVGVVPGVCTITVNVVGTGPTGNIVNTIPANNVTSTEGITNTQQAQATMTISPLSIGVVKEFFPLTVFGGSASTMTITLINPTTSTLIGAAFTDTMPVGMIVASPVVTGTTCAGGVVTAVVGAGSFSFSGGNLPGGTTCQITISITMTVNGNLTNTIPAGGVTTTNGASNPQAASASLTNLPGVSLTKAFTPNSIPIGGVSALVLTIRNTNGFALTGLNVTDTLPAGLTIAATAGVVNTCNGTVAANPGGNTIQLTGGDVGSGLTCTVGANITGTTPNPYTNIIPAGGLTSIEGATNTTDATDTLTVTNATATPTPTVTPPGGVGGGSGSGNPPPPTLLPSPTPDPFLADPQISKTGNPSLAIPGDTVQWDIAVTNRGTGPALNFVVNETLPGPLQFLSASADQGTFNVNGQSITFNIGTLNPRQVVHLRIQSRIDPNAQPPMNLVNVAVADWLGRRLRATATVRLTRGRLPNTGEKGPTAPPSDYVWLSLVGLGILMVPVGYVLYRRRRPAA